MEELARRGYQTLLFGPMKPVGLVDPRTGKEPFAVVQLRQEDKAGRMWSLVGFQTGLKWPEQKRLIQMIPGLENAEIVRYGVMHRNTYLNAPRLLGETLEFREAEGLYAAGVLAGVEGYLESAATGFLAGLNAARKALGLPPWRPRRRVCWGACALPGHGEPGGLPAHVRQLGPGAPGGGEDGQEGEAPGHVPEGPEAFSAWLSGLNPPLPRPEAALV